MGNSAIDQMRKTQARYANKKIKELPDHIADQRIAQLKQKAADKGWDIVDHKYTFNVMHLDQDTINDIFKVEGLVKIIALEAYQEGFINGYKEKENE